MIVPLRDFNLYLALMFLNHVPPGARGEDGRGTEGSADKAWSESCRGGQCGGEIGQLHGKKEAERDHFLALSLARLSFPVPPPLGSLLNVASLSHAAPTARCVRVYKFVCVLACMCARMRA